MSGFNRQQQDDIRRLIDRFMVRKNNGGGGGGTSDHGSLSGLADDDHLQYHNDTRGDARYYTKAQSDAAFAGISHTHAPGALLQSGASTGQVLTWNGAFWAPATPSTLSLSSSTAYLGVDVTMTNANQWYTGPSLGLASGTWLIMATATVGRTTTTAGHYGLRITSSGGNHASTQQYHPSVANNWASLSCNTVVSLGSTDTILLQCYGSLAGDLIKAAIPNNSVGNNATGLVTLKIG